MSDNNETPLAKFDGAVMKAIEGADGGLGAPRTNFLPTNFAEAMEMAKLMASGNFVPGHLRGKPGDCLAVVMQSSRWGMDPFAVGNKTYFVNDRMAYEAQLIAAVLNSSGVLRERLQVSWFGANDELGCIVKGRIKGEDHEHTIEQRMKTITTNNSPLWKQSPQMQLAYYTQRLWARLFAPEVLMGVYAVDEVMEMEQIPGGTKRIPTPRRDDPGIIDHDPVTGEVDEDVERQLDAEASAAERGLSDDDAPELTEEIADAAQISVGDKVVREASGTVAKPARKPRAKAEPKPEPEVTPVAATTDPSVEGVGKISDGGPKPEPEPEPAAEENAVDEGPVDWDGWLARFKAALPGVERQQLDQWKPPADIPAGFLNRAQAAIRERIRELEGTAAPKPEATPEPEAEPEQSPEVVADALADSIVERFEQAETLIDLRRRKADMDDTLDAMSESKREAVMSVFVGAEKKLRGAK